MRGAASTAARASVRVQCSVGYRGGRNVPGRTTGRSLPSGVDPSALSPFVAASTPIPVMKWFTVLPTGSIGIRTTFDHVEPSFDVLITMSFDEQFVRNLQSNHAT